MNVGPAEILVILFVALLVFGPHRLPEVARQVGGAMRQLRQIQDTVRGELDSVLNPDTTPSFDDTTPSFDQTEPPADPDPDPFPEPGDHTAIATQTGSREITGPDDVSSPTAADGPSADDSRFAGPTGSFT
jgi:Tat protein translocase TatB subunit